MVYRLVIDGRLPGTNEYTGANRAGWWNGRAMKKEVEEYIGWMIRKCLHGLEIKMPVNLLYVFCEPHPRRDRDNIYQAQKFIQDALVQCRVLQGDGWEHILHNSYECTVDAQNPRIEVYIIEQSIFEKKPAARKEKNK